MDYSQYTCGVALAPLFVPATKEQLSPLALQLLQDYCDIRNDCADTNPDLFGDEPFKILSIDTMCPDDVRAAIEIQEHACEYLSAEEIQAFFVAANELRDVLHSCFAEPSSTMEKVH